MELPHLRRVRERALLTGMRRGEILWLLRHDVDIDRGALMVRRTLSRGSRSTPEPGEPKTVSGRRRISIPASVVDGLRRHRVRHLEHRLSAGFASDDQDHVFANRFRGPLHPNSLPPGSAGGLSAPACPDPLP